MHRFHAATTPQQPQAAPLSAMLRDSSREKKRIKKQVKKIPAHLTCTEQSPLLPSPRSIEREQERDLLLFQLFQLLSLPSSSLLPIPPPFRSASPHAARLVAWRACRCRWWCVPSSLTAAAAAAAAGGGGGAAVGVVVVAQEHHGWGWVLTWWGGEATAGGGGCWLIQLAGGGGGGRRARGGSTHELCHGHPQPRPVTASPSRVRVLVSVTTRPRFDNRISLRILLPEIFETYGCSCLVHLYYPNF